MHDPWDADHRAQCGACRDLISRTTIGYCDRLGSSSGIVLGWYAGNAMIVFPDMIQRRAPNTYRRHV